MNIDKLIHAVCQRWLSLFAVLSLNCSSRKGTSKNLLPVSCSDGNYVPLHLRALPIIVTRLTHLRTLLLINTRLRALLIINPCLTRLRALSIINMHLRAFTLISTRLKANLHQEVLVRLSNSALVWAIA